MIIVVDQKRDYASLIESYLANGLELPLQAPVKVFARPIHGQLDGLLFAMCQARGDYMAIWDDDNMNHPERLAVQVDSQRFQPTAMTVFGDSLYYFHASNELFVTPYDDPRLVASERCAISTLMGPRDVFPAIEPQFRNKPVTMMVDGIHRSGRRLVTLRSPMMKSAFFHVVGVSFDNLRGYETHRRLAQNHGRTAEWLARNAEMLVSVLDEYKWDVPEIDVVGADAFAFKYKVKQCWPDSLFPLKLRDGSVEEVFEQLPAE
jgi:hypothetical protein